jgi:hypothetical protein
MNFKLVLKSEERNEIERYFVVKITMTYTTGWQM